ncbi:MAG: O-antigen ligase family protein [Thiotrichaceae bacterium]|nr:O-antigen ligase family protein [Thiotrichaceae bacterium]
MLPPNITVWLVLSLLVTLSIYKIVLTSTFKLSKIAIALLVTLSIMLLLGIFQSKVEAREITLRVLQVIGFLLVFISLIQYNISKRKINTLFYIIAFSALIQILYALAQLYHNPETTPTFLLPYLGINSPPVGAFLQVNIMAMFLVTATVIAIYLFLQPSFKIQNLFKKILLLLVFLGGSYLIMLISSRASFVALSIAMPIMIFSGWQSIKNKKKWGGVFLLCFFLGGSLGLFAPNNSGGINKILNKTTNSRALAWKLSLQAIKEKPLLGYGLGGFTKAYFDQNEKYTKNLTEKDYKSSSFFTHPHNEILYWWVESGIFAIITLFSFIIYYLIVLFRKPKKYALQYIALLVPIGFHTQVSLPFYLSTLTMLLFIFLLVLPMRSTTVSYTISPSLYFKKFILITSALLFLSYTWFLKETVSGTESLVKIQNNDGERFYLLGNQLNNPYWGDLALTHAHVISMVNEYSAGNKEKAFKHLEWMEKKVEKHEDPTYYFLLLKGYKLLGEDKKYAALETRLSNRYPKPASL